jgi:hypothetical protein
VREDFDTEPALNFRFAGKRQFNGACRDVDGRDVGRTFHHAALLNRRQRSVFALLRVL